MNGLVRIEMPNRVWLSMQEAANRAGVSRQALQQAVSRGELTRWVIHSPNIAIARNVIDLEELDRWIEARATRLQG
jgi:predicted DNA-binding protein (UPF0251 family)